MMTRETKRTVKVISLGAAGTLLSFLSFYSLISFFINEKTGYFVLFSIFCLLFLALVVLQSTILDRDKGIIPILVLQGFAPLVAVMPFVGQSPYFLVWGAAIFSVFIAVAVLFGIAQKDNNLKIKFFTVNYRVLSKIATGFIIMMISVSFVYFIQFDNLGDEKIESLFGVILGVSDPILETFIPGASFSQSLDDMISDIENRRTIEEQLDLITEEGSTEEREAEINQDEVIENIEGYLGDIDTTVPLNNLLVDFLTDETDNLSDTARNIISLTIIIPLFILLKFIFFILYPVILLLSLAIYKILILTGFIRITSEQTNKETIKLVEDY